MTIRLVLSLKSKAVTGPLHSTWSNPRAGRPGAVGFPRGAVGGTAECVGGDVDVALTHLSAEGRVGGLSRSDDQNI